MSSPLVVSLVFGQIILVQYVESILFVLGITGSLMNILLFSQRKLRSNSCCTYFLSSSVAAIVLILVGIAPQLYALNHTPAPLFNRDFCKVRGYIGQSSAMLCRWLLTIACVDRCLSTSTNAHLRLFSTVCRARKIVLFLSIIWLIIPIHMLIFTDVRRPGYIVCMMGTSGSAFYHTIYTIMAGGLIPPFIMLISTKIIWKSLQLKREHQEMIILHTRQNRQVRRDIQVLMMLLLQVTLFIIFTLPYMIFNLYLAFTRSITTKSADRLSIESFLQLFSEVAVYVYPAMSFYSNTLVSQTFRNQLITLFRRILICNHTVHLRRHRNRIVPNTMSATAMKRNDVAMTTRN